jgi:Protein of unknown function (DUF2950)
MHVSTRDSPVSDDASETSNDVNQKDEDEAMKNAISARYPLLACAIGTALLLSTALANAAAQQTFDSPQAGVDALVRAVETSDQTALHALFGADSDRLLSSGDSFEDSHNRTLFDKAYETSHRIDITNNSQATLVVGKDEWPMPIPLVKDGGRWHFDTQKGADEILARRIGRNEISTMKACLAIVDAQREFAARTLDADGVPVYTSHFVSESGKHDGLYWPTATNQPRSPLGALLAHAATEGYAQPDKRTLEPYLGYYYRILTRQGKDAHGGPQNFEVKGKLIGGFALIAYPARYNDSGVMSFIVSDEGVIYEKNLGSETQGIATATVAFDPDKSWEKVNSAK